MLDKTTLIKPRCMELAELLEAETYGFDMGQWCWSNAVDEEGNICGTAACIAGHALLADGVCPEVIETMEPWRVCYLASTYLQIDVETASRLFDEGAARRTAGGSIMVTRGDAIAALRALALTGELPEWWDGEKTWMSDIVRMDPNGQMHPDHTFYFMERHEPAFQEVV